MAVRYNKKGRNTSISDFKNKLGIFIRRFFVWIFFTLLITIAGLYLFLLILLKGPSDYARDCFVKTAANNSFESLVLKLYLSDDEILSIISNQY